MKIVITGGVAGGATAAARLRRMDGKAQIILFERGEYVSYANCGLPYYIGGTIYDLQEIEHAYAPPFSSAKDPVNIAGFVAENILQEKVKILHWEAIDGLNKETTLLIDVRTKEEYDFGHIDGAFHIPVDEIRERLEELPKDKTLVLYCAVGLRGYMPAG